MTTLKRLGVVYRPSHVGWQYSHAQNPFPQYLPNGRLRIHFASRDANNRSQGAWIEIEDLERPTVLATSSIPSIALGKLGCFDDAGAMPHSMVQEADHLRMYYTGWTLGKTVPFWFYIGLAISTDGGKTFQRLHDAPIVGRTPSDPYMVGAPWVLKEAGRYRMWYSSCTGWEPNELGGTPKHYYTIKYAESVDGISWTLNDQLCMPYQDREYAVARPVVFQRRGGYEMFFSYRADGTTYRLGRATSANGIEWSRQDPLPLEAASGDVWDSEMVCYACPVTHRGQDFVLYNGRGYGRDGFGAALMQDG